MGRFMKRLLFMLAFFCLVGLPGLCISSNNTLAVLDFENNTFINAETYGPLSKGLAEMMITELNQLESIRVVERQKLRTVMDELKLSQTGLISEEGSLQVGEMVGAHHLVFGSFMVMMDEKIRIDMRIVQVETGLTMQAGEVTGKTKQVLDLIHRLSKKMLKDLDIRLTRQEEKILDASQKLDMRALVHFSMGIELEDQGKPEEARVSYRKALEIEPMFQQASDRLEILSTLKE